MKCWWVGVLRKRAAGNWKEEGGRSTKKERVEEGTKKKGLGEYPGTQEERASENQGIRARGGWSSQEKKRCAGVGVPRTRGEGST